MAVRRSHIGLTSRSCSRSKSPWRKNSCIMRSVQRRYSSSGLVGLLRSEQCTRLFNTYNAVNVQSIDSVTLFNRLCRTYMWTEQENNIKPSDRLSEKQMLIQEAFEKCWAHSPLRAVTLPFTAGVATVARCHCRTPPAHRCPRNDDNDNAWQRGLLWPHRMGPMSR